MTRNEKIIAQLAKSRSNDFVLIGAIMLLTFGTVALDVSFIEWRRHTLDGLMIMAGVSGGLLWAIGTPLLVKGIKADRAFSKFCKSLDKRGQK